MNKNKRKIGRIVCLLAVCGCALFCLHALAATEATVTNSIETGVIDIGIAEYQEDENGGEEPYEDHLTVLPGMYISKIPRITNYGYDCYVRVKLAYDIDDMEDTYQGIGDNWIYREGYYYCTDVLKHGESVDIFQGIRIPEDFSQTMEEEEFHLFIQADAIQSQNFAPSWNSDTPWGAVEIQECRETGPYEVHTVTQSSPLSVTYDGEAKKLFAYPDSFFQNFPTAMPGDTYQDTAELKNNGGNTIQLYFSQETNTDSALLKHITLEIWLDGEELFRGTLGEAIEKRMICELPAGTGKDMTFRIHVPEELDNHYTLQADTIRWRFSCDEIPDPKQSFYSIKTGDMAKMLPYIIGVTIAGLVIAIIIWQKKKTPGKEVSGDEK